jgi:hypothetical protein
VAARGHRIFSDQMPFLDQGLSVDQMVEHFRLKTMGDVPNAQGLRDWDLPQSIHQGLPFYVKSMPVCPRNYSNKTFSFPWTRGKMTLYRLDVVAILPFSGKSGTLGRCHMCFGGSGTSAARSSLLYC